MKVLLFLLPLIGGCLGQLPLLPVIEKIATASCSLRFVLNGFGGNPDKTSPSNQDNSAINFYFWKREGIANESYEITYGNQSHVKAMNPRSRILYTYVYFHDTGNNGKQDWIIKSANKLTFPKYNDAVYNAVISVNYEMLVLNKTQALRNIEPISNHSAVVIDWILKNIAAQTRILEIAYVGHGIGAFIASRTSQRIMQLKGSAEFPEYFTSLRVLDLENFEDENLSLLPSCYQQPTISKTVADNVMVIHTSSCLRFPPIPACNSGVNATVGKTDIFPNGGGPQPGCSKSDLLCNRKRAASLYAEALMNNDMEVAHKLWSWRCGSFADFEEGKCQECVMYYCLTLNIDPPYWPEGRFYLYTNSEPRFGRGLNQTKP